VEQLNEYFEGIAWKYLSAVDADPGRSNQHELGGLVRAGFRDYLGDPGRNTVTFPANYVFLAEEEDESLAVSGTASWYDSRRHQIDRGPELRLYYDSNPVTEQLTEGMFMVVAKLRKGELILVFARSGSSAEQQLRWLFGIEETGPQFRGHAFRQRHERRSWAAMWILEQIGIEVHLPDEAWLDRIIASFGEKFPPTRQFAAFARAALTDLDPLGNPDESLMRLTEAEERFFRLLERHIVQKRLDKGFSSVDEFVAYSLSVHNTRKSRAGHSLENHLEFIFTEHGLKFERGAYTESRSKPDFLFPGIREYKDENYPESLLTMLGVKTTCKDRWRQVLREAERIPAKHLATLEPGISVNQTQQMDESGLQLVLPEPLLETYTMSQRDWIWTLADFIEFRKSIDQPVV
jgi:hypothetical protein